MQYPVQGQEDERDGLFTKTLPHGKDQPTLNPYNVHMMLKNNSSKPRIYPSSFFQAYCWGHTCEVCSGSGSQTFPASLVTISCGSARLLLATDTPVHLTRGDRVRLHPRFSDQNTSWPAIESEVTEVRDREVTLRFAAQLAVTGHRLHRITTR